MKSFSFYSNLGIVVAMLSLSSLSFGQTGNKSEVVKSVSTQETNNKTNNLQMLKDGNQRFITKNPLHSHQDMDRVHDLVKGQNPMCVLVSCSDSRVAPEIIFDQGLGDIFSIRTAGNVMSDYEEGSIEYAVEHLQTPLVIVMGHQGCGAIQAMLDSPEKLDDDDLEKTADHVSKIVAKLKNEDEEKQVLIESGKNSNLAVVANVMNGVKQLRNSDPVLQEAYKKGEINIVGAVYHLDSGEVEFLNY